MIRNLKVTRLALLLVVLTTSVLAATGAFAGEEGEEGGPNPGTLSADAYPATLDGTDVALPLQSNAFTLFGMKIECPDSSYSGVINGATGSFTIVPTYNKQCLADGKNKATIMTNGCDYQITLRKTTIRKNDFVDNYFFTTEIVCPGTQDIEIYVYTGDNENVKNCEITIKAQKLMDRGKLQNELKDNDTTGTFTLENHLEKITATKNGACGHQELPTGKIDLSITFKGTTELGAENKLKVTDQ